MAEQFRNGQRTGAVSNNPETIRKRGQVGRRIERRALDLADKRWLEKLLGRPVPGRKS